MDHSGYKIGATLLLMQLKSTNSSINQTNNEKTMNNEQ
jgi:hypothetical protein